jgi:murein DD-endopeptidase MepM/ murein hydrolase activator NlpD
VTTESGGGAKDSSASQFRGVAEAKHPRAAAWPLGDGRDLVMQSGERVIDEDAAGRGGTPSYWHGQTGLGWNNDMLWTYVNGGAIDNWAVWRSGLAAGRYEVSVFIPRNYATTRNARYRVEYYIGDRWTIMREVSVNQYDVYDAWVSLGTYDFPGEPAVFLADDTGESYSGTKRMVGFDAVKFAGRGGTSGFRWPLDAVTATSRWFGEYVSGWGYHLGQDYRGGAGTAVYAVADGKVVWAHEQTRYGFVVVVEHQSPTVCSVYGHLRRRDAKVGVDQTVSKGTLLGYLGTRAENGGWAEHLHFGIRKGLHPGYWVYYGYGSESMLRSWEDPRTFIPSH